MLFFNTIRTVNFDIYNQTANFPLKNVFQDTIITSDNHAITIIIIKKAAINAAKF